MACTEISPEVAIAKALKESGKLIWNCSDPSVWDNIRDHLRIGKRLGRGAFGQVYQAFDMKLRKIVALKIIEKKHLYTFRSGVNNMNTELEILTKLKTAPHPHVCKFYRFLETADRVS